MVLVLFLFCLLESLTATISPSSNDSFDHPIRAVYQASHSTHPATRAAFDSWSGSLPYPNFKDTSTSPMLKAVAIWIPRGIHLLPRYLGLEITDIPKMLLAVAVVLITAWNSFRALSRAFRSGTFSSMLFGLIIIFLAKVKYLFLRSIGPTGGVEASSADLYLLLFDLFFGHILIVIQIILVLLFNWRVGKGTFRTTDMMVDHAHFVALLDQTEKDNRPDVAASLVEWASNHPEIHDHTDGSFYPALDACLSHPGLTKDELQRHLHVLFFKLPQLTSTGSDDCPELAKWRRVFSALDEFEEIHRKVRLLEYSPVLPFDRDLRLALVASLVGVYDR